MRKLWPLCLLLALLPLGTPAQDTEYKVDHVINGKSFVLTSGDTVRLASIEVPNTQEKNTSTRRGRPGEPMGDAAKQALTTLLAGKTVTLHADSAKRDRHNRLLGQVYTGDIWVQGALLSGGYAMVYSFADTPHDIVQKMLVEERNARSAKRGIWAHPYFRVITPTEADEFVNRFKLVEGKVVSVKVSHENTYINFFEQWKGHFAVFISRKHAKAFAGSSLGALTGKNIRVRGWIHYHNAPAISITHPDEIEVE